MSKNEQIKAKAESLTQLELKANLNPQQRAYLAVLKDKMKKILRNKTKQELARSGDLLTLKNYRLILLEILNFLRTKQIPRLDKRLWDWEIGSRELVDMAEVEKQYGVSNLPKPIFTKDGENFFVNVRQSGEISRLLKNNIDLVFPADGEEPFEEVVVSDDGKHVLAIDINNGPSGKPGKIIKVDHNDWEYRLDDMEFDYQAQFSPDSFKLAMLGTFIKNGRILVENDHKIDDPADDLLSYVAFSYSPDGYKKAIVYDNGQDQKVIDGDKKWKKVFKACSQPVYSADASKLAIVDNFQALYINDKLMKIKPENGIIEIVGLPVFSPDSQKIAFVMKQMPENAEFLYEDGEKLWNMAFKNIFTSSIVYSPNCKNIACVARNLKDKIVVIVNGTSPANTKSYEAIEQLTFSPDGEKIMFIGLEKGGYSRVVADVSEFVD